MNGLSVLGFLGKDTTDPLQSPRSAGAWLRQLPALDVMARQQEVMRAFEVMRQNRKPADLNRVGAIGYLDAALGTDRRQLIKQYVENVEASPKLAYRVWQALQEMTQGFVFAYRAALDQGVRQPAAARWKPMLPMLFARLIHYYGTDSKLRVFRFERWIPAKWMELHRLYLQAVELGIDRAPTSLVDSSSNKTQWTIEQEYIYVLLMHQLNTGNLTPLEIDWASAQIRIWSRKLALAVTPRTKDGFFVSLDGKVGLQRRTGKEAGETVRYLDTTPLADQLERAIFSLRKSVAAEKPAAHPSLNAQRVAVLERLRPALAPSLNADMRRGPRIPVQVSAKVRVGLAGICRDLAVEEVDVDPQDAAERIEVFAVNDGSRPLRQLRDERDSMVMSLSQFSDPMWQVKDRSVAGLRIAASGGIGQSLQLGSLVAVRQSDLADWVIGIVRRLNKASNDEAEAGLSVIAQRAVPVTLNTRREQSDDYRIEMDGVDISTVGARFDGLYLPPPSRPDRPLNVKSLVVPTSEYVEGRELVLLTGRSVYTIALRHVIEQRAEWTWTAIQVVQKKAREQ